VTGRWATRAAAAAALAVLLGGVPLLLVAGFGWPIPSRPPSGDEIAVTLTSPPSQRLVGDVVAVLGWVTWVSFVVSLVADLVWTARHGLHQGRARRPLRGFTHALIAALITGSLTGAAAGAVAVTPPPSQVAADHRPGPPAVFTEVAAVTHAEPQQAGVDPAAAVRRTALWSDPPPVIAAATGPSLLQVQVGDQRHTVRVDPGDTLWDLAAAWLGDPMRWPEILDLNRDRYPTQGGAHPEPGWVLVLPADATPPAGQATQEPAGPGYRAALWEDPPPVPQTPGTVVLQVADQRHDYQVGSGATLRHLAETLLGDPRRWPEIDQLNPGLGGGSGNGQVHILLPDDATIPATADRTVTTTATGTEGDEEVAEQPVYEVKRGDWMWHIAGRYLGDEQRYPEIAALNPQYQDRYPDYPDHIQPGDRLILPDDAHDHGQRPHATGDLATPTEPDPQPEPAPGEEPAEEPNPLPEPTPPPAPPDSGTDTPSPSPSPSAPPATTIPPSGSPEPDGVVPAPTSPTPTGPGGESTPPAVSTPPAAGEPPDEHPDEPAGDPAGVDLPGGWVGIGLAAAIAAAAAWVWQRRRHRHRLPASGLPDPEGDPDLQPLPPVVARLRGAVRRHAPELLETTLEEELTVAEAAAAEQPPRPPPAGPSGPQLAGLGLPPAGGVGVTGPGAAAAARALLVASLSAGGPADPDAAGEVVIPAGTLADLLGGQAVTELVGAIPRLHVTAGIGPALTWLDEQILTRIRTLGDYDLADLPALRADPWHEPAPPLMLIAEVPEPGWRARLSATMHLGQAVDTHAVLLGAWTEGTTVEVAADGTTDHTDQPASTLDVETTLQLLTVLAEAHTGQPPPGQPQARTPTPGAEPDQAAGDESQTGPMPADQPPAADQPAGHDQREQPETGQARRRVRVRVLGRAAVEDTDGNPVSGLRATAAHLLVFLACHRDGANIPDVQEAIWPEATLRRAGQRLSTTVANLRWALRTAAALSAEEAGDWQPVVNTGGRYHLNPDCVQVDWWQVRDAAAKAAASSDAAIRRAALTEAVDVWGGLVYDNKYEWIDPYLHTCRQYGLAIHTQLAELVADTDPQQARNLLDAAADIDPLNEQVACLAMRAHARLGETTAIKQRLATLTRALDEVDVEVDDATRELAGNLIDQATGHRHQPPAEGG
jgi:nucleoid-associated protein YgaU/two-component SAPR family response regulator